MVRGVFVIGFLGRAMVSCPVKECSGGNSDLVNVGSGAVKECSEGKLRCEHRTLEADV